LFGLENSSSGDREQSRRLPPDDVGFDLEIGKFKPTEEKRTHRDVGFDLEIGKFKPTEEKRTHRTAPIGRKVFPNRQLHALFEPVSRRMNSETVRVSRTGGVRELFSIKDRHHGNSGRV